MEDSDEAEGPFDEAALRSDVWRWLDEVVIALNLCPFAAAARRRELIRLVVLQHQESVELFEAIAAHMQTLAGAQERDATTVIALAAAGQTFDGYLELLAACNDLLTDLGLDGQLQIASFHPDYCFADAAPEDPANGTNRAPWPLLHLLREDAVAQAVAHYPKVEEIPENNQRLLRQRARQGQ